MILTTNMKTGGNATTMRGMSLIELLIAMTLGLLIVGGMATLFVQNQGSSRQDEQVARMQEDARYALNSIVDDVEMVGFWADIHEPANVTLHTDVTIDTAADCSGTTPWIYVATQPVVVFDDGATINSTFDCIAAADAQASSDAIAINRVLGEPKAAPAATEAIFLKSNGATGILLDKDMADSTVSGVINYWQYTPKLYYVRNYAEAAGDGIPTLCVYALSEDLVVPKMEETCIAQGVESLQVEYGIDTDTDGVANRYLSAPTAAQLQQQLVAVRVHLLMRALEPDYNYDNEKSYSLGDLANYTPADNFYRRVYTTTVLVRNTRNLLCVNAGC